ncbi:MAG: PDZ domain-containing protein, partial [Acidobacteria bacterium]|nr:PDZ domain-containing protein [Acidobacteriota bacterium]
LVNQAYVEPADDQMLMTGALDGATDALDPFSVYVPAEGAETYRTARLEALAHSGLILLRERGVIFAVAVGPGSPADAAGIEAGDMVAEIDGEPTRLTPLWQVQRLLARPAGSEVKLKVFRNQELKDLSLTLGTYVSPAPEVSEHEGISVVKLFDFDDRAMPAVRQALKNAADRSSHQVVVDVRGIATGSESVAYDVAGLFVSGELGGLMKRQEKVESFEGGAADWQGDVVVLVDRSTLGPAEILATVLRQKAGAELVGERTFGYAGRLKEISLPSGGQLWITDAFYSGPDGEPLHESLVPDVRVSVAPWQEEDAGEAKDEILERGLDRLRELAEAPAEEKAA